jgi:hypothetical protein
VKARLWAFIDHWLQEPLSFDQMKKGIYEVFGLLIMDMFPRIMDLQKEEQTITR